MKSKQAIENFKTMNCAQSVLTAFSDEVGLDKCTALRVAAGFGGGMGNGDTCGAVTGACMVIGLLTKEDCTAREHRDEAKAAMQDFNKLFKQKHGSLLCKKLLGVDISTTEGLAKARKEDLFGTVCTSLVESAAQILEDEL